MVVPPLHSEVVTATVNATDLHAAQRTSRTRCRPRRAYAPTPRARRHRRVGAAVLRAATSAAGARSAVRPAREEAGAAPTPPLPERPGRDDARGRTTSRSCSAATASTHIDDARKALFDELGVFELTSIRKGFVGGGFAGEQSLPKQMAMRAGIPGADLIPDTAELFLGFTSTQQRGPRAAQDREPRDARLRRPGATATSAAARTCTSRTSTRISRRGTSTSTSPSAVDRVPAGLRRRGRTRRRCAQGRATCRRRRSSTRDYEQHGTLIGHSASIQTASRLAAGRRRPRRHASTRRARRSRSAPTSTRSTTRSLLERGPSATAGAPARGGRPLRRLQPDERRLPARAARDGRRRCPDGTKLAVRAAQPRRRASTRCSATTHRQNFLVPPRRHRSFPLAEL